MNPRSLLLLLSFWYTWGFAGADSEAIYNFDDSPRAQLLEHPDWFKESFLDLGEDLQEALAAGKRGIIVYFGQRRCAYCHKLMQVNFGRRDIAEYTKRHFDVIPIDIWGVREVIDLDGTVRTERAFTLAKGLNFTPSLLFYDAEGREALRLRGYYPPYPFQAALEYVVNGYYLRESFRDYLARGENRMVFDAQDLNDEDFFSPPPFNLDRSRYPSDRPLVVFFERGDCHACDVLHGQVLREPEIRQQFFALDSVQLDLRSDMPVVTPAGERTTARKWAEDLGIFYTPSLLFFDPEGKEILRVDSVVRFYRLRTVLDYINSGAYRKETYGQWRAHRSL